MDWKPVNLLEKEWQNILRTTFKMNYLTETILENLSHGAHF